MKLVFAYDKEIINDASNYKFQYPYFHNTEDPSSYPYEHLERLNAGVPANGWPAHDSMSLFLANNNHTKTSNNEFERSWVFRLFEDTLQKNQKEYELITVNEALNNDTSKFIYPMSVRLWCFPDIENIPASCFINNPFKLALSNIIPAINNNQCCLFIQATIWPISPVKDRSKILALQRLLKHAGLKNLKNVVLITAAEGDASTDNSIKIKTFFWEHFESSVILNYKEDLNYNIKLNNCKTDSKFKRFLFLNHKERPHRVYLFYKLCTKIFDFHEKFAASFCPGWPLFLDPPDTPDKKFYNKFSRVIKKIKDPDLPSWFINSQNREEFCKNLLKVQNIKTLSLTCDLASWDEGTWRTSLHQWTLFAKPWEYTGIYIGTETIESYKDNKNNTEYLTLTEKTFKPIAMKSPFIIYGQPFTLKKLREYGYKTFDSLWDESYDLKTNLVERTNSLIETIHYLNNLSNSDFYNLLEKARDIVEYNYNHMMNNRYPEKHIYEALETFYNE